MCEDAPTCAYTLTVQEQSQEWLATLELQCHALHTGDMRVAGLEDTTKACCNGVYALQIGTWTCGRPVYKQTGTGERYLFRSTNGEWFISDKEDEVTGEPSGWVATQSRGNDAADTPDQLTGGWNKYYTGSEWVDAPKVGVVVGCMLYAQEDRCNRTALHSRGLANLT